MKKCIRTIQRLESSQIHRVIFPQFQPAEPGRFERVSQMGLWSVLFEIVKAVAPHAAPHVTKAVVNAARDRMGGKSAPEITTLSNEELASLLAGLERRVTAAETRASAAEQELETMQTEFAGKWKSAGVWVIALLAWNSVLTALLIYLAFFRK